MVGFAVEDVEEPDFEAELVEEDDDDEVFEAEDEVEEELLEVELPIGAVV